MDPIAADLHQQPLLHQEPVSVPAVSSAVAALDRTDDSPYAYASDAALGISDFACGDLIDTGHESSSQTSEDEEYNVFTADASAAWQQQHAASDNVDLYPILATTADRRALLANASKALLAPQADVWGMRTSPRHLRRWRYCFRMVP
jgi:hypothetical protein